MKFNIYFMISYVILTPVMVSAQFITNTTFTAFDIETTGLNPKSSHIIEIGAVRFKNGKIIKKRSWLINPGIHIPVKSQQIHGITDKMIFNAPSFPKVFHEFKAFIKNSILLAHNASFDTRFIASETKRYSLEPIENIVLDTLAMARKWFPNTKSHTLQNMIKLLNIQGNSLHRALADSQYVATFFIKSSSMNMADNSKLDDLISLIGKIYTCNPHCITSTK